MQLSHILKRMKIVQVGMAMAALVFVMGPAVEHTRPQGLSDARTAPYASSMRPTTVETSSVFIRTRSRSGASN